MQSSVIKWTRTIGIISLLIVGASIYTTGCSQENKPFVLKEYSEIATSMGRQNEPYGNGYYESATFAFESIKSISVSKNIDVIIIEEQEKGGTVEVTRVANSNNHEEACNMFAGAIFHIEKTAGRITISSKFTDGFEQPVATNLLLRVNPNVEVNVDIDSGKIELDRVSCPVNLKMNSGSLDVKTGTGGISAIFENAIVNLDILPGRLGPFDLKVNSGHIDIGVKKTASCFFDIQTTSGELRSSIRFKPKVKNGRTLLAAYGAAQDTLRVRTNKGSIKIRKGTR